MGPCQFRQDRCQRHQNSHAGRVDAQNSRDLTSLSGHTLDRLVDVVKCRPDACEEPDACFGERDASRRSGKEWFAQPILNDSHGMTHR
jgi:hypothetical protein